MKNSWQISLLLASEAAVAHRVIQGSVLHFQSQQSGPWQPLLSLGFGTPSQEITGIFDTGSSDVIVPLAGSELCRVKNQQCAPPAPMVLGQFDPRATASDIEVLKGKRFDAGFSGGDRFTGEYVKTSVAVGESKVPKAQVALASGGQPADDFPQFPIFGVGPKNNEATDEIYDNLLQVMNNTSIIKGNSFSVVLDGTPFSNGSVFFGGVDRSKFTGNLQEVKIDRDNDGNIRDFVVKMSSLHLSIDRNATAKTSKAKEREIQRMKSTPWQRAAWDRSAGKAKGTYSVAEGKDEEEPDESVKTPDVKMGSIADETNRNNNVGKNNTVGKSGNMVNLGLKPSQAFTLMDTGGVIITLPSDILTNMAKALDTYFSPEQGIGPVDCAKLNSGSKLVMGFNDDHVKMTLGLDKMRVSDDLVDPAVRERGMCELGVASVAPDDNLNSMGFPFFADVYTVFDLENNSLWFAQATGNPGAPAGKLEEFP